MSNNIDKRIVEMQFDNKQFESGIQTSVKSLEELKKNLNLEKSAKGLSALSKAGKSFSLAGISESVETISSRFSALGIIGVTALQRITNSAIDCGKRLISSLTIDPVKTGFSEYETQINAVQTILANTSDAMDKAGYSQQKRLNIVNEKLDQLNAYADKTIYNFTEMTRNIGTFTAAGVDLETSVSAIQGIANLAAVSGSNSQQASTAMYQLSQALSTGTVKLMDWNSVVNAGMGGEVFQKALIRTASAMGVTGEKAQEMFAQLKAGQISFRDSLSSGWLSSDILTETLGQMAYDFEALAKAQGKSIKAVKEETKSALIAKGFLADEADEIINLAETATNAATKVKTFTQLFDTLKEAAQSGWTQSWEYIVGDFEEAKELLTSISDYFGEIINASSEARNQVLSEWKNLGGRDQLIEGFWNIVHAVENVVKAFKGSFEEFFPPATGQQLFNITKGFNEFTQKVKSFTENTEVMDKVGRAFRGIAAALDLVRTGVAWVWNGFKKLLGVVPSVGSSLLDIAARIGDFFVNLRDSVKNSEFVQSVLTNLGNAADSVRDLFVGAFHSITNVFSDFVTRIRESERLTNIGENVNSFLSKIPDGVARIREWGRSIIEYVRTSETLRAAYENVRSFFAPMINGIQEFGNTLKETLKKIFDKDSGEGVDQQPKNLFEGFGELFSGWFQSVRNSVEENWGKIKEFISNFFTNTIPNFFASAQFSASNIAARIKSIDWGKIITTAIGIYSAIKVLSSLGGMKSIGSGLKKIGKSLSEVGDGIKNVAKNGLKITKQEKDSIGTTLLKIAASIGILVGAIWVLSKMDTEDAVKGLGIISILAAELLAVSVLFGKVGANANSFLSVAVAITLLVIPIKLLSSMETEKALKGIIAVGAILTELGIFMRLAGKGFEGKSPFLSLSIAVNLLVLAVKGLAEVSVGGLVKGLAGMEVLLLELSAFMKKAGSVGKVGGMLTMALGINLMVRAVKKMGNLDFSTIVKGVSGLGAMMLAFGAMIKLVGGMKLGNSLLMLLSLAGTLILFIEAFKQVEGMNTDSMLGFSISLSATLLALSASMKIISSIPIGGAISGLGSFAILIVGIGGIITALGWLQSKWQNMSGFLDSGGDILGQIGTAIGKFVGGIASGFVQGLNLPQIGSDLSAFMTNASGFIEGAKTIDGSVVAGVGYLAGAILAIGAAEVVNAILTIFGGESPIVAFSGQLKTLGEGLMGYAESVKGFSSQASTEDINSSVETAKGLGLLNSSLPATGGKLQDWLGTQNLSLFSTQIMELASGLKEYAANVKGFSSEASAEDLNIANTTAQGLADLNNSLPATGGTLQDWLGEQNLSLFSTQIVELATGLKSYLETVQGFSGIASSEDLTIASDTATGLSTLNNSLPATGGALQDWLGTQNLSLFSTQIVELASGLKSYLETVNGFSGIASDEDLATASDTATGLSALNNSLPYSGGKLANWLFGEKDLSTFATGIGQIGSGLKAYATSISGFSGLVNESDVESAKKAAMALSTLNNSLPSTGGTLSKWLWGEKDLNAFATNITLLGQGLASFARSISSVSLEKSDEAIDVLDMLKNFIDRLDPQGGIWQSLDAFVNGDQFTALTNYTNCMRTVALDLSTFGRQIRVVKIEDVQHATAVFESVKVFIDSLTESGGVLDDMTTFFTGDKSTTLTKASATMRTFGSDFGAFAAGINNIATTEANFEGAKRVLLSFKYFNDAVKGFGEIEFTDQMDDLLYELEIFGTSLKRFSNNLGGVDVTNLSSAVSVINTLVRLAGTARSIEPESVATISAILDEYGKISIQGFLQGFQEGTSGIDEALKAVLSKIDGYQDSFSSVGTNIGSSLMNGLVTGISASAKYVTYLAGACASSAAVKANSTYKSWYSTGQNLGKGLSNGISSMAGAVRRSALNAAAGALRSIQMSWSVHSPSRVTEGFGEYFDLGLIRGIDSYSGLVSKSAENVGRTAIDSAKWMLANLTESLANGVDVTPTIRPVLDLSAVQNGVSVMNGMFDSARSVRMNYFGGLSSIRNASALNLDGTRIVNGAGDANVVNELRDLASRFDDLNEAVRNMKLVMDNGALVGQISAKMDSQLGTIASRRGRGN